MNELAHADCLEYMAGIPDESVQLVFTSPPYNIGKSYEKHAPMDEYLAGQKAVIVEAMRMTKPTGSICWQVGNHVRNGSAVPLDILLYPIFDEFGLILRNRIIWQFGHGLHCRKRFSGRHETVLWFTKGDDYTFNLDAVRVPSKQPTKKHFKGPNKGKLSGNPLGKNPEDVWYIGNVKHNHPEKIDHPCQFPVQLAERFVLALTDPGDTVLDPYMGSGTTAIAAVMHDRIFKGCDREQKYAEAA